MEDEHIDPVVYVVRKIESAAVEQPGEGTLLLDVLTLDGSKTRIELEGLTPGMMLDALLASPPRLRSRERSLEGIRTR